jgi:hypothetical protein
MCVQNVVANNMVRRNKFNEENRANAMRYMYFVVLVMFVGLAVIMYNVVMGISDVMALPSYIATLFQGSLILSFTIMGLIMLYPLVGSSSKSSPSSKSESRSGSDESLEEGSIREKLEATKETLNRGRNQ